MKVMLEQIFQPGQLHLTLALGLRLSDIISLPNLQLFGLFPILVHYIPQKVSFLAGEL